MHSCTTVVYTRLHCVIHNTETTKLILYRILCYVDRASLNNLFQMKPTRCTLFLIYLFQLLYVFRATVCPLSGELTVSMRHWYFSLCMGGLSHPNPQTRQPPILTYLFTSWCRVLLEKLTGLQLVKKFPAFHGTRKFITALTRVRQLSLSWASPIQSIYPHPTSWRSILILSTHLRLGLPSGLFPSGFPTKTLYTLLSSSIRATCPANSPTHIKNHSCFVAFYMFTYFTVSHSVNNTNSIRPVSPYSRVKTICARYFIICSSLCSLPSFFVFNPPVCY